MLRDFPIIIADESLDGRIIKSLVQHGFSIYSISKETAGISDSRVIEIAIEKKGYIITEDKDFGDQLVYLHVQSIGSMLLRFSDISIESRIQLVIDTLSLHADDLRNCFSVLTSKKLRIRKYS